MLKQFIILFCLCSMFANGCQNSMSSNFAANEKTELTTAANNTNQQNASQTAVNEKRTVIAYYFHRTMRCPTCLAIEANAHRILKAKFPEQIAADKLIWIPYNLDEPDGDGLEKEFNVSGSTLVLVEVQDGNHIKYKKLEKVWNFIGDPVKFDEYVQTEVNEFLNE